MRALRALATPGGHLATLLVLFFTGVAMTATGLPKAEDVLIGTLGALLMAINGRERAAKPKVETPE